ncbi:MAG: hypothetical protein KAS72_02920 [Phycisphaerales bacterium]|nr:hypothetical protein [Phycisphaerales bacterium]
MRRGAWAVVVVGLLILLAAVVWPALAVLVAAASGGGGGSGGCGSSGGWAGAPRLFLTSVGWAGAVGAGATLLGWAPGVLLGRKRSLLLLALFIAMLCIPSYVSYYAWGLLRTPGTMLGDWIALDRSRGFAARHVQAWIGLVGWAWPIVAICVAAVAGRMPRTRQELARLEPCPVTTRIALCARETWPGALLGWGVTAALIVNSFVNFHLASIPTYGLHLDVLRALVVPPGVLLAAGLPSIALAMLGACVLLASLRLAGDEELPTDTARAGRTLGIVTAVIWLGTCAGPAILIVVALGSLSAARAGLARSGIISAGMGSACVAACVALVTGVVCINLTLGWSSRSRWVRRLTTAQAAFWLTTSLVPGTIAAMALGTAYNRDWTAWVYGSTLIVVLAHVARFSLVSVLLARFAAARQPKLLRDMRELDGATTLTGWLRSSGPWLVGPAAAAGLLAGVLSMGEVATTVALAPPGASLVGAVLLNQLHYAHDEVVLVSCLLLFVTGFVVMLVLAGGHRAWRRWAACLLLLAVLPMMPGCEKETVADPTFEPDLIFGSPGYGDGQFAYPRAITLDPVNEWIYVVDKAGRVQRFTLDGACLAGWTMPKIDRGKPTGIAAGPDGNVWVADTHEQRVIVFTPDGEIVRMFGSYGTELGQFIYPNAIAFDRTGKVFVSEFGSNDRITTFQPDGTVLRAFGEFGYPDEQTQGGDVRFNRPQSIIVDRDAGEIFIADACNHRIVVTDLDGNALRTFGTPGDGLGELRYPYDLAFLPDGTLLVCEYGNSRLQRFTRDGEAIAVYGSPGRRAGELTAPWGVVTHGFDVFVLDSRNNRVQRFTLR